MASLVNFRSQVQKTIDAAAVIAESFRSKERYQYYFEDLQRTAFWVPESLPDGDEFFLRPENRRILRNLFYLAAAKVEEPVPERDMQKYLQQLGVLLNEMRKLDGKIEFDRVNSY